MLLGNEAFLYLSKFSSTVHGNEEFCENKTCTFTCNEVNFSANLSTFTSSLLVVSSRVTSNFNQQMKVSHK